MTEEVRVRPARREDGTRVLAMLRRLAVFEGSPHPPRMDEAVLERDVFGPAPKLHLLVAEWAGSLAGVLTYFENYSTWEGRAGVHVTDLWVEEEARGQGVGEALLEEVFAGNPGGRVDAFVLRSNQARGFYERLGFSEQAEWCLYRRPAGRV